MKKAIVLTGIIVLVLALTVSARGYGRGRGNSSQNVTGMGLRNGSCITDTETDFTPCTGVRQAQGMMQGNRSSAGNINGIQRQSRLFYSDERVRTASIAKYDSDKDGTLDQDELLKMREEHDDLKDQFDSDDDGRLSDEEFTQYKNALYKELGIE